MRDPELFQRALRAAAAVTGVLKKSAVIGVAAGAFTMAGCGPSKSKSSASNASGGSGDPAATVDAGVELTCDDDPGYGSDCCKAQEAKGLSPIACTPWGPPAPPAYAGERLA